MSSALIQQEILMESETKLVGSDSKQLCCAAASELENTLDSLHFAKSA